VPGPIMGFTSVVLLFFGYTGFIGAPSAFTNISNPATLSASHHITVCTNAEELSESFDENLFAIRAATEQSLISENAVLGARDRLRELEPTFVVSSWLLAICSVCAMLSTLRERRKLLSQLDGQRRATQPTVPRVEDCGASTLKAAQGSIMELAQDSSRDLPKSIPRELPRRRGGGVPPPPSEPPELPDLYEEKARRASSEISDLNHQIELLQGKLRACEYTIEALSNDKNVMAVAIKESYAEHGILQKQLDAQAKTIKAQSDDDIASIASNKESSAAFENLQKQLDSRNHAIQALEEEASGLLRQACKISGLKCTDYPGSSFAYRVSLPFPSAQLGA